MPENNEPRNALDAAITLIERIGMPITVDGNRLAIVPEGCDLRSLEEYGDFPSRRRGSAELFDVASFIAYVNLFKDSYSRIFANDKQERFVAVLDYHKSGVDGVPRFGEHRCSMTCRKTSEWITWSGHNNKQMDQVAFALFIEDNMGDIIRPSGAVMLEAARSLKGKKDVDFRSDITLSNGQVQFHYNETVQGRVGGGDIEVPEAFTLRMPVYLNATPMDIEARLRWRFGADKKLSFWYTLAQAPKILERSFAAAVQEIATGAAIDVLLGEPTKTSA